MSDQSSMHAYLNWTKQRIDEMDAILASLEAKVGQVKVDSKADADRIVADLKQRRDEFEASAKAQAKAGQAAIRENTAKLESQWRRFETEVNTYFETVGKQAEQQKATFLQAAGAQAKAWRETAEAFHNEAGKVMTARRADIDVAVTKMKADAAEAEARLHKLMQAGGESWAALSAALAESRQAFDRANQQAGDALKGGAQTKSESST
ncbi:MULTISPECIES: hypothetical protein [unclassified Mesorhizobium]|uniref:hypothetical protein n=1 Tax=unclassified Mesorhizobium TaxID=325217 RepID=UPI000FCC1496|nr:MULTISPECIES: hypothetical protein [unclassified Mesorhizobium]RUW28636.1 hypothetical protein EOA38_25200 [Mesorhizobium sp. M1E.F.Ca.ET.041.01.1.1]RWD90805.1 MAG: hypothetical protein EOS38_07150 [Mesorhizobium sp.]RWD92245.1 MAG: hypothetical protein EOS39_15725 [Mesorhizobium sp.]TIV55521.1 MAG: hypothetical protein E5V88_01325 [Mesorhizobium sp.]